MKNEIIQEILNEAANSKTKIHIKLKDKTWRNGHIISIKSNYFIFQDLVNEEEEAFFFLEVEEARPFIDKGEGK